MIIFKEIYSGCITIKFDKYIKIILLVYKMEYFKDQLFSETLVIKSSDLLKSKNIDGFLHNTLKKNENKCNNNGYVIEDTTKIIQRSIGKISSINNQNFIQFSVNYQVKLILPNKDDIFECIVDNITHMGIVAYLDYKDKTIKDSPVLFIIPKQFVDDEIIKDISINSKIKAKVLDTRIKFKSEQIQVIAEYVK